MDSTKALSRDDLRKLANVIKNSKQAPEVIAASPYFWFVHWTRDALGYYELCDFLNIPKNQYLHLRKIFRSFVSAFFRAPHVLKLPKPSLSNGNLIFSWCNDEGIDNVISGQDRYFGKLAHPSESGTVRIYFLYGTSSKEQVSKLLEQGYGVIYPSDSLLERFKNLAKILLCFPKKISAWPKVLNYDVLNFIPLLDQIRDFVRISGIKRAFFPYEAQPIQNNIIFSLREQGIESIGYIHSSAHNFPSYLTYRPGSPDLLLVHGSAYKELLEACCGWPRDSVKEVDCFRFRLRPTREFESRIFLPYFFSSRAAILKSMKGLIERYPEYFSKSTEIRLHPAMFAQREHQELGRAIADLLPDHSNSMACSVVIGISSTILEALENGVEKVFQVTEDPYFEAFSDQIWPSLSVEMISEHVFKYRLHRRGSFLNLQEKAPPFDQFIFSLKDTSSIGANK